MGAAGIPWMKLYVDLGDQFELIEAEFGLTGFAVVVKLLQRIYGGQGYYCEWTEDVVLLFSKKIGEGGSTVSEIVRAAIKRGIFDKDLYDKYHILTSAQIQCDYFEAVSRRKEVNVKKEYLLISDTRIYKNVNISGENVNISGENVNISKQRREEKRREENTTLQKLPPAAVSAWKHDYNVDDSMIDIAVSECVRNKGETIIPYIDAILRRWYKSGIHTAEAAERDCAGHNTGGAQQGYADTAECKGFFEGGI